MNFIKTTPRKRSINSPTLESSPCARISCSCLIIVWINSLYPFLLFLFMLRPMWGMDQCISLYNNLNLHRHSSVSNAWMHTPIYGSPFNLYSVDLWISLIESYAWIWSKSGLLSCLFPKIWHWLNICKTVHSQISLIGCSIMPPWFLGSGHSVDSVLAMCAHLLDVHMHFIPKSIIFVHINIIEHNAFMWFPLAFQNSGSL